MDMVSEKEDWTENNANANFTKLVKKLNNEQDVFNECLQISTDLISMLRHSERQSLAGVNDINSAIYFTNGDFTLEPFQERFDNMNCFQKYKSYTNTNVMPAFCRDMSLVVTNM